MKKILLILPLILCACDSNATSADLDKSFTYQMGIVDCGYKHQGCMHFESFLKCEQGIRHSIDKFTQKELDTLDEKIRIEMGFDENAKTQMENAARKVSESYMKCI
ncbi:MAG: hypothetical protein JW974_02390 [Alphaproteobacteria bacterium]|nr:hypothetical protein [Alphaproteobacteria bacterium]MBN2675267.1 hypothetical protein [Alphaproteobacteria bacterium]